MEGGAAIFADLRCSAFDIYRSEYSILFLMIKLLLIFHVGDRLRLSHEPFAYLGSCLASCPTNNTVEREIGSFHSREREALGQMERAPPPELRPRASGRQYTTGTPP
nr:hypothetical protein Iba_chr03eCG1520 [Ipomoea batatas]